MTAEKTHPPPKKYDFSNKFQKLDHKNIGGNGCFNAGVFVVKRKSTGEKCVEKRYTTADIENGTAEFEMKVLRKYRHPNIVEYLCGFIDRETHHKPVASVYMEHCDAGNLDDAIEARAMRGKSFSEKAIWDIFLQLVNAVAFLQYGVRDACFHPRPPKPNWVGVLHRDIKPGNIFLCNRRDGSLPRVVLGDFGQGLLENDDGKWGRQYMAGNLATAPPEVMAGGRCGYTFAGDAYAVGATISILCTGQPFMKGAPGANRYSQYLKGAISKLLKGDQSERPQMDVFGRHMPKWQDQGLAMPPRHAVG